MNRVFDSPWTLRIVSFLLAFLLYLYVIAESDARNKTITSEQIDVIKDVPLEVYYDNENLIVSGVPDTIDMTIKGPQQLVLQTKSVKDFTVFLDLREMSLGLHEVKPQYENISDKLEVTIDPGTIELVMEEKVTKEFKVDPEINNNLIAKDHILSSIDVSPTTVFVTGSKSDINSISYVKANVMEEDELTESFEQMADVRVLDRDLNKLDIEISPEKVAVDVNIKAYTREVPIEINQVGNPPEGVTVEQLKFSKKIVKISGVKQQIDQIEVIKVDFDVSKINESKEYEVKIPLPNGATTVNPEKVKVNITTSSVDMTESKTSSEEGLIEPESNVDNGS